MAAVSRLLCGKVADFLKRSDVKKIENIHELLRISHYPDKIDSAR